MTTRNRIRESRAKQCIAHAWWCGGETIGLIASAQAQHQMQSRLLLDVVVRESAAVLELLAREDEALLVRRDALLVLDLRLDVVDGVRPEKQNCKI